MKSFKYLALVLSILALLTGVIGSVSAQSSDSQLRFMHAVPGVAAIDVYADGALVTKALEFGTVSTYVGIPSGSHQLSVTLTGTTSSLWEQTLDAPSGEAVTLVASSTNTLGFSAYNENLGPLEFGKARLLLIHAVDGAPNVDVALANGNVIAPDIAYGSSFGTFDIPAGVYELAILPTGGSLDNAIIPTQPYPLNAGTLYMAVVYGRSAAPSTTLLSTAAVADSESGFVRFAHTVVGAPAVDVFVNDTLIAPSLDTSRPTDHIALPVGEHTVALRVADADIVTGTITVAANSASTFVAFGTVDDIQTTVVDDEISNATPDTAVLSVVNTLPDSEISITLADGTVLADGLAFGDSATASFAPTTSAMNFGITLSGSSGTIEIPEQTFYGGVFYNAFALAGDAFSSPRLVFTPTRISQTIASTPGGNPVVVTGSTSSGNNSEVVSAQPTEAAQVATAIPTQPPATQAPVASDVITGRVNLNPGVNLQLRQYPDANALSLGLAPSGTVLTVNGRVGAKVFLEGQPTPTDEPEFVDPALFLEDEDADLIPEETWVNVTYSTPDGGAITAWVLAFYLDVRDPDGKPQRLADLPFVPENQPGEAVATQLTPPPVPEDRVTAVVFNLSPGVSLNIRRTKGTDGEVLERLPNDTVTEFLGFSEDREWIFIQYLPAGGGTITGWVSAQYIRFEYNGNQVKVEDLEARELMAFVEDERRGDIRGATQVALPTVDPLKDAYVAEVRLNEGTNLQFRLDPDADCQSLGLIPNGTRVIVNERSENGVWLKVTYEGQAGWVASGFVLLSFNNETVELTQIPITTQAEFPPCVTFDAPPTATPSA